jgi:hypothetical protein
MISGKLACASSMVTGLILVFLPDFSGPRLKRPLMGAGGQSTMKVLETR